MGYRWRKTKSTKHLLMESQDVAFKQCNYLKKIEQYRKEKRPIIFTNESYVNLTHISGKSWSDGSQEGICTPLSKGERHIFLHTGEKWDLLKTALLCGELISKQGIIMII